MPKWLASLIKWTAKNHGGRFIEHPVDPANIGTEAGKLGGPSSGAADIKPQVNQQL